jgi:RHS repeat-associated protein
MNRSTRLLLATRYSSRHFGPSRSWVRYLSFLFLICIFNSSPSYAQVATGTPQFGSFGGGPDVVNLGDLNVHLAIPVLHKKGRGADFTYDLSYDTSVWYPVGASGSQSWHPVLNWGWRGQTEAFVGYMTRNFLILRTCRDRNGNIIGQQYEYYNWTYHDSFGISYHYSGITIFVSGTCGTGQDFTETVGGYTLSTNGGDFTLNDSFGKILRPPLGTIAGSGNFSDRNGNIISVNTSGVFTDTLGTTALTVSGSGTPSSPMTFTYTAPSGANAAYTVKYQAYAVQTKFNCSGISEYGPTSNNLVTEIDLPDIAVNPNDKYTFIYEQTPGVPANVTGRLASVTLPTGGTISYQYSGGGTGVNGITCVNGGAATLTRTTPDGVSTYALTLGTGSASTTTITDPQNNNTVIQFQGTYETQRQVYQGAVSPSNLLQTTTTCYNGNTSNCTSTSFTLPITQRNITTTLSGGLQSEHDDFWNAYSAATETDDYDFGSAPHGPLLKKVTATYANMGMIQGMRQTITTFDGSGNTVSKIVNNYDETSVVATSGTPQHSSVTGSRGNLTSVDMYINSTTFLAKHSTYFDTGNVQIETDVNGAQTTYTYGACGNSFPTSISKPLSLSRSETWNCTGGVQLTVVDENNATTTTAYTDAYFWRPASITDPTNALTSVCYGLINSGTCTLNTTQLETTLNFNSGNSTVDRLTTLDPFARTHVQQTRQSPNSSNFDSVETDYDSLGRVSRITLPYVGSAGQTNSSVAGTTTTYDAISRPLTVLDGGGGSTIYFYGNPGAQNNDTFITRSPAASGENTKRRQFESDALGRLTSVCELTAGTTQWPGGNCAQNTNQTGYWTKYSYDPMGNLMTVTQNAQMSGSIQSRSYAHDWLNRMTSETVPEIGASGNGTAYYTYDSDSTCGASNGDLVKRVDAAGDVICSSYDALHRELTRTYPSGTYASVTATKHFVYDSATVNSVVMNNVKARLAEAYTCTGSCSTKLTDLGFSYTVRGETSDVYESTPNSGTYYHASQTYWANQTTYQLTGNIGLPTTITYTPDAEGRINTVSATSGQNPVSSTAYSSAGLPTAINLGSGSGDADTYQWDPSTNRMTQYKFTVNAVSLTANLGWNANNTLQTQNITDGFNSADTQNCSYSYDDITRVTSANCVSAAAQTFSYDPFGNINKAGSPYAFNAFYSTSTNRITCIGGSGQNCTGGVIPTYDSNGNVTNDSFHNYAWDADGHAITVDAGLSDAVSLTYDALGRMVEQQRGSAYTQIAYSVGGQKLALMSGSTLQKAMVPLSGQAQAVYNSSGLLYYAHPDLLGSVRLATTPSRTMYFDTAYAPFGETYASAGGSNLDPAYTGQMADTSHRQDTAGGLYDFPAREYSIQGRWPAPDPAGISATCAKNPQTQNRYAYVTNNPLSYVDPLGTQGCSEDDPNCGACDPSTDPFCGLGPPILGGGFASPGHQEGWPGTIVWPQVWPGFFGLLASSSGDKTKTVKKDCGRCGDCSCDDWLCKVLSYLFPCGERGPSEGCSESTSKTPGNTGNQCAGMKPPLVFIEEWNCAGDALCCQQKYTAYLNKCYDAGNQPVNVPPLFGGVPGLQCCKLPKKSPK